VVMIWLASWTEVAELHQLSPAETRLRWGRRAARSLPSTQAKI